MSKQTPKSKALPKRGGAARQAVLKLWPDATIVRVRQANRNLLAFMVTIKPGRYAFGDTPSQAWAEARDSITQDDELSKGKDVPPPKRRRALKRGETIKASDIFDFGDLGRMRVGNHYLRGRKYWPGIHQRIIREVKTRPARSRPKSRTTPERTER